MKCSSIQCACTQCTERRRQRAELLSDSTAMATPPPVSLARIVAYILYWLVAVGSIAAVVIALGWERPL